MCEMSGAGSNKREGGVVKMEAGRGLFRLKSGLESPKLYRLGRWLRVAVCALLSDDNISTMYSRDMKPVTFWRAPTLEKSSSLSDKN